MVNRGKSRALWASAVGVFAACGGSSAPPAASVTPAGADVVMAEAGSGSAAAGSGSAAPPPVPTPRVASSCGEASFAILRSDGIDVYDVYSDCRVLGVGGMSAPEGFMFRSATWPSRDGALFAAAGDKDGLASTVVLRFDQPRTEDSPRRAPPVTMKPPGKGDVEPEGYTFGVAADDRGAYVERCRQWGEPCDDCEEIEEWPCQEHIYFPVAGGKQLKPAIGIDRFATPLVAGRVPGTEIDLSWKDEETLRCSGPGTKEEEVYVGSGRRDAYVVAPISKTSFLLGQDSPGGRSNGARSVDYTRIDACAEYSGDLAFVVGPGGLWASRPREPREQGVWTLTQGDLPINAPVLEGAALIWTR